MTGVAGVARELSSVIFLINFLFINPKVYPFTSNR